MAMKERALSSLAAAAALIAAAIAGCESEDARTTFAGDDAGAPEASSEKEAGGGGTFAETDAGCTPTMPGERAAPKTIRAFEPGACSPTELQGYVSECLKGDGDKCAAFKSASATCAACIESQSTDETWGPIVFYEGRTYYDYNQGGCIANVTGDLSAEGCGAAQTAYLECHHAACSACIENAFDLQPFYDCENGVAVDKVCAAERTRVQSVCQSYFGAMPEDACQGAGLSADAYILQLVTAWCGSSGDGGTDAGDAGDAGDGGI